jgi:hypothetical protein
MIGFISASVTLSLLITINTALSVIYTIYSSPLHTQYDFPSLLVISWLRISTQKLVLWITMKSSCDFVFNHSVLFCPTLYSINLHNSLRTRSILVLVHSTANPPGLFTNPSYSRSSLYRFCTDITENTVLLLLSADHRENKSRDSYLASPLARWLLPSNELRTFVLLLRAHNTGC